MFALKRNSDGTIKEARMIAEGYVTEPDEEIGLGERLPEVAPFKPAPALTLDDIIAVLPAPQQAALQARLEARKSAIQIAAIAPK